MKKLLFLVMFFAPMGAQAFSIPIAGVRLSPFRFFVLLSLLLLILKLLNGRKHTLKFAYRENIYSMYFMLAWVLYAILTVAWAKNLSEWFKTVFFISIGLICAIIFINVVESMSDIVNSLLALMSGIFIQSIIGWYEVFTRDYHWLNSTAGNIRVYVGGDNRIPIAMCGNPNDFATLMFFGTCISYYLFLSADKVWKKIISIFLLVDFTVLLLLTRSRANVLALIISAIVLIVLLGKKKLVLFPFMALCLMNVPLFTTYFKDTLQFSFGSTYGSDMVRLNLIKNGLLFLEKTFGFGVGAGQIEYWMQNKNAFFTAGITNMHNWWIEILASFGLVIFIGYLAFYCNIFITYVRAFYENNDNKKFLSIMVIILMSGFVVSSISSSSNMNSEYLWAFWALCIAGQRFVTCTMEEMANEI